MGFAPVATYSSFPAPPPARNTAYRAHLASGLSSRASSFAAGSGLAVAAASVAVAARPRRTGAGGGALRCKCLFGLGVPEMVVIAGVAALLFGPKQLPEIGRSVGKTIKSFQQAAKEFETELKKEPEDGGDQPPPATATAVSSDGEEKPELEASSRKESTRGQV
ncbi:hypothetical protein ACQ4PT_050921 [Festuca glaucescens]